MFRSTNCEHAPTAVLAGVVNIRSDQRDRIRKTDDRFILFAGLIEQPDLISLRQIIVDLKDRVHAAIRFRVDASEYLHRFRIVLAEEFTLVLGERITLFEQFDQQVVLLALNDECNAQSYACQGSLLNQRHCW